MQEWTGSKGEEGLLKKNCNTTGPSQHGRVIPGSSYDVRSVDVLDNLKWKNLETRRSRLKAILKYPR